MFRFGDDRGTLKCSFCGKNQDQVRKLIAGPGVYICDECIELCNEIIEDELSRSNDDPLRFRNLPKPQEINQILDQYVVGQIGRSVPFPLLSTTTTSGFTPRRGRLRAEWKMWSCRRAMCS